MKDRELLITTDVVREKGWIYFVGTDEKGCVTVERAKPVGRPRPETIRKRRKQNE